MSSSRKKTAEAESRISRRKSDLTDAFCQGQDAGEGDECGIEGNIAEWSSIVDDR